MQIMIVTNEEERKDFVEEVGEEVLPEDLGGRAKLVALQDVTLPPPLNDESSKMEWGRYLVPTPMNVRLINNADSILLHESSSTNVSVLGIYLPKLQEKRKSEEN